MGKQKRVLNLSMSKLAVILAAIFVFIGFFARFPQYLADAVSVYISSEFERVSRKMEDMRNHHLTLSMRSSAASGTQYYQGMTPTELEKKKGKSALQKWKSAKWDEQNYLIDDIIAGDNLIGLDYDEIESYFGKNFLNSRDSELVHFMRYSIPSYTDCTELVLVLGAPEGNKESKVQEVYLSVN